jgi:hypothetical protein
MEWLRFFKRCIAKVVQKDYLILRIGSLQENGIVIDLKIYRRG